MRLQRRRIALVGIALMQALAVAASATDSDTASAPSSILVTGSHIKRISKETPSPVQVLTQEQITQAGFTSLTQVLQSVTANGSGNLSQAFSEALASGGAGVSLRGLTVDATLVLIDGHRMAFNPVSDDGQRSFVDVSNIPLSIVDRVEVLKDGASAIYGSDAIAGVVNIILKKRLMGGTASADYGVSSHGDAMTERVAGSYGWGDFDADGHNTYAAVEYRHQSRLMQGQRPGVLTNFDFRNYGPGAPVPPGAIYANATYPFAATLNGMVGMYNPANPAQVTQFQYATPCASPDPSGGCVYSLNNDLQIQPDTHNLDLFIRHTMSLTEGWQANIVASMFDSRSEQLNAPASTYQLYGPAGQYPAGQVLPTAWTGIYPNLHVVNTTDPTAQPILLPVGNVNNPYPNNPAWLAYTFGDVGPQHLVNHTDMYRLVGEVSGTAAGWDINASAGVMRGLSTLNYYNYVSLSGLQTVLANNSYYLGDNAYKNSPSVYATLAPATSAVASSTLAYFEANGTRPLMHLPGGDLSLALGLHVHHLNQFDPGQPGCAQGDVVEPVSCVLIDGSEQNEAVYAELDAPLLRSFEVNAAVREDHYAWIGDATTPKISFAWRPWSELMVRGTYARGFRAPGPGERGEQSAVLSASPPLSVLILGNPQLQPEHSETFSGGIVWQPTSTLSATVDWYKIRRTGSITPTPFQNAVVQANVFAFLPYVNADLDLATGIDVNLQGRFDLGSWGRLTASLNGTHIILQEECLLGSCYEFAGTHGNTFTSGDTGTPRNRMTFTLADEYGPVTGGFDVNYTGPMRLIDTENYGPTCAAVDTAWYPSCTTGSFSDVDLFAFYKWNKQLRLNAHVLNVFDRPPTFDPQTYGGHNYNPAWSQPGALGRYFQLGADYHF